MDIPFCEKHCRGLSLYLAAYKEDFESAQTHWILTAEFQIQHQVGHLFHCKRIIVRSINKTCVSLRKRHVSSELFSSACDFVGLRFFSALTKASFS